MVSSRFAGNISGSYRVKTLSDEKGHYRLEGIPNGQGNEILAMPRDDQPYFMREFKVPAGSGFETVKLDLDLNRGVLIEGRVTDKVSGVPLENTPMHYVPWPDIPHIKGTAEARMATTGPQDRYQTDRDGRYRLVGVPGRFLRRPMPPDSSRWRRFWCGVKLSAQLYPFIVLQLAVAAFYESLLVIVFLPMLS